MKKTFTKSLAVLLALLMAFSVVASAIDLPGDLTGLPALVHGVTAQGSIQRDEFIWYTFTPDQGGYYLFPTTGGYDNSISDYIRVGAAGFAADGSGKWEAPYYEQGETYYVRVYAFGTAASADYTVAPKLYQYAEPLLGTTAYFSFGPFYKLADLLEGSPYTMEDVDHWSCRGDLYAMATSEQFYKSSNDYTTDDYIDIYFSDGTYTVIYNGAGKGELGGLAGMLKKFLDRIEAIPIVGSALILILAPLSWLMFILALLGL